jgi:tetratricopeptide (TPR) repeat protein
MCSAGQFAEAATHYSTAIALCPKPKYHSNRALCRLKGGDFQGAVDDATQVVNGASTDPEIQRQALYVRTQAYAQMGRAKFAQAYADMVAYRTLAKTVPPQLVPLYKQLQSVGTEKSPLLHPSTIVASLPLMLLAHSKVTW